MLKSKKKLKLDFNCTLTFIVSNSLGVSSQKRCQSLSASVFKKVSIYWKKVVRHTHDSLSGVSYSSNESAE